VKDNKTRRLRYAIAETNCCDGIPDDEATANARLIAAAPRTHNALKALIDYIDQAVISSGDDKIATLIGEGQAAIAEGTVRQAEKIDSGGSAPPLRGV
jgi:hypothetical protein